MGGPTGAREIGPHRGGGGKREKAISPGRGGAEEEIVNAHLSLGLEIIPIVHRNYDGWTIRWSLPARRPTWDHEFESDFLQQRVTANLHHPAFGLQTRERPSASQGQYSKELTAVTGHRVGRSRSTFVKNGPPMRAMGARGRGERLPGSL